MISYGVSWIEYHPAHNGTNDVLVCTAEFAVEHINEIKFNPDAFENLVLPEAQKNIVKALVESHAGKHGSRAGIDDVIKGKGKGLVAVLQYAFSLLVPSFSVLSILAAA